jgi:broad specificity phosphatase PhoE
MSDQELISSGFNIDTRYRSQVKNLRTSESEYEYYIRSKETMKKIIKLHGKTSGTILLVAHAPSLEVLTRHLMNGQPRPEQLSDLSARVGYCSMTIVDSEPSSKTWRFRY